MFDYLALCYGVVRSGSICIATRFVLLFQIVEDLFHCGALQWNYLLFKSLVSPFLYIQVQLVYFELIRCVFEFAAKDCFPFKLPYSKPAVKVIIWCQIHFGHFCQW